MHRFLRTVGFSTYKKNNTPASTYSPHPHVRKSFFPARFFTALTISLKNVSAVNNNTVYKSTSDTENAKNPISLPVKFTHTG